MPLGRALLCVRVPAPHPRRQWPGGLAWAEFLASAMRPCAMQKLLLGSRLEI